MIDWVVVADDLTGACDTGVTFTQRGYTARVAFDPGADFSGCDVRVLTTESRALPPAEAAAAVEQALVGVRGAYFYKKIDSTLRGNPGAELDALLRGLGERRALVSPAFPEQGRVVQNGQLFVHGVPLGQTAFAGDVSEPDLSRLFAVGPGCDALPLEAARGDTQRLVGALSRPGIHLADAETSADLQRLARAGQAAGIRVFCGAAGLARGIVDLLPAGQNPPTYHRRPAPILVIAGSRAAATAEQVEALRQKKGLGVLVLAPDWLQQEARLEAAAFRIAMELKTQQAVVVHVDRLAPGDPVLICAGLARLVVELLRGTSLGGLVLTGGETAAAVCRALGCTALDLGGEVQPGVVWSRFADGPHAGLPVVTKAGGFGDPQTLVDALQFLLG